jgi:hypothetical protein
MNERARIAFLAACLFVIGLHLRTAGRLIVDGWLGPYAPESPNSGEPARPIARAVLPSVDQLGVDREEIVPADESPAIAKGETHPDRLSQR